MPRFHFHVHNSVEAPDLEGIELPDLQTAIASAVVGVRALMSDEIRIKGAICLSHSIEITDANGLQLHVTRYGDGVKIAA